MENVHESSSLVFVSTKTKTRLLVGANLDQNTYPRGIKISNLELEMINIDRDDFHREWNYWIKPNYRLCYFYMAP